MASQAGYFQGEYVNHMRDLTNAVLLTGTPGVLIGAPGWGKTDIPDSMMYYGFGEGRYKNIMLNGATKPGMIQGETDLKHLIAESEIVLKKTGTVYDPKFKGVILDEFGRTHDTIYQLLLEFLHRKFPLPIIGTANFMPVGPQHEALLDRFNLWHWVSPSKFSARAMAMAQMTRLEGDPPLMVPGKIPTEAEIHAAHNALPGLDAMNAIGDKIDALQAAVEEEGWVMHPRRVGMWHKTLFRVGYWASNGNANFSVVPDEAMHALRFAWPSHTEEEYGKWKSMVMSLTDPLQAVLDTTLDAAVAAVNNAIDTPAQEAKFKAELTAAAQMIKDLMKQYGKEEKRLVEASAQIKGWFYNLSVGERVSRF